MKRNSYNHNTNLIKYLRYNIASASRFGKSWNITGSLLLILVFYFKTMYACCYNYIINNELISLPLDDT